MDHYLRSTLHRIVGPDSFCLCILTIWKAFNLQADFDTFISDQNSQPRRLQNPCECPESGEDGVAHEDAGLCLDAVEGGDRGHLRLQTPPQGVRAPQLFDPLQGEERARWETFLKWFSGASILPDLHSCGGSAQKKAHSLHCARPNSQHNTGLWRGQITDVTTRKNNNNNNIIRTATAQLSLGLNGTSWGKVANRSQTGLTGRVCESGWWGFKLFCKPSWRSTSVTGRDHHEQCDEADKGHL